MTNPCTAIEEICKSLYETGLNDGKHGIHYFPTPVQFRVNQLLSLIATIQEEALKKGFADGYEKGRVKCLEQHYKVEEMLPYGAGFTRRFYPLKDGLSQPSKKDV